MKRRGIIFTILLALATYATALATERCFTVRARDVQTSKIMGTVLDENGARIVGARVKIEGEGLSRSLRSDEEGRFEAELPAGTYRIAVRMDGFKRFDLSAFRLRPHARESLAVRMEVRPSESTLKIG